MMLHHFDMNAQVPTESVVLASRMIDAEIVGEDRRTALPALAEHQTDVLMM
jgi:hypothetical protein